jgi:surface polysaccharide O-acyltransferase-like enzyme
MASARRVIWADLLKIFAIYGVIIIHSAAPYLVEYKKSGTGWWAGNLYDSFNRWCIPVFFMLSGTFILEHVQKESVRHFLLKRFKRVCVPFFLWSALYFFWRVTVNKEQITLTEALRLFIREPAYYHLWFIYTLIGLYFLSPFIGIYLKHASRGNIRFFLLTWFVFGSLLPTIESLFSIETYMSIDTPSSIFYYTGYFVLGYLLRSVHLKRRWLILLVLLFITAFIFTVYGTYYLTVKVKDGQLTEALYEYYSVNVLIMSIPVFLITKSVRWPDILIECKTVQFLFHSLALCIPGIYLVHAIVISVFKGNMLQIMDIDKVFNPWIGIPLFATFVLIVSFCIVYVIRQVPGFKNLVP